MALLQIEKMRKDLNILFKYVKCLMAKSEENSPLVATAWFPMSYTQGTFVYYEGHVYKCLINHTNFPPTNTIYWLNLGEGHLLEQRVNSSNSSGLLYAQIEDSPTIENTSVEISLLTPTGIGSLAIPPNTFAVGDSFKVILVGKISCDNGANLHIRVKTRETGDLFASTGHMNLSACSEKSWRLELDFTIRQIGSPIQASIVSSGLFSYIKDASSNYEGVCFDFVNEDTFDTTELNTLDITAQWLVSNPQEIIYSSMCILSKV